MSEFNGRGEGRGEGGRYHYTYTYILRALGHRLISLTNKRVDKERRSTVFYVFIFVSFVYTYIPTYIYIFFF